MAKNVPKISSDQLAITKVLDIWRSNIDRLINIQITYSIRITALNIQQNPTVRKRDMEELVNLVADFIGLSNVAGIVGGVNYFEDDTINGVTNSFKLILPDLADPLNGYILNSFRGVFVVPAIDRFKKESAANPKPEFYVQFPKNDISTLVSKLLLKKDENKMTESINKAVNEKEAFVDRKNPELYTKEPLDFGTSYADTGEYTEDLTNKPGWVGAVAKGFKSFSTFAKKYTQAKPWGNNAKYTQFGYDGSPESLMSAIRQSTFSEDVRKTYNYLPFCDAKDPVISQHEIDVAEKTAEDALTDSIYTQAMEKMPSMLMDINFPFPKSDGTASK